MGGGRAALFLFASLAFRRGVLHRLLQPLESLIVLPKRSMNLGK